MTGYVGKSKIKSSGASVRSKSMRSRGSRMSKRRGLDGARRKAGRFNEEMDTYSRKSHHSRHSRHSRHSKATSQVSRVSRRPQQQAQAQGQAFDYGEMKSVHSKTQE